MKAIICDGSSRGNPGPASIGVVIWDRKFGTASARRVTPTHTISRSIGHATNNEAEWEAVLAAMQHVVDTAKGFNQVFIYSDSLLVVSQANGDWKVKDPRMINFKERLDTFADEAELRQQQVKLTWLPRQLTVLADKQAQNGHHQG